MEHTVTTPENPTSIEIRHDDQVAAFTLCDKDGTPDSVWVFAGEDDVRAGQPSGSCATLPLSKMPEVALAALTARGVRPAPGPVTADTVEGALAQAAALLARAVELVADPDVVDDGLTEFTVVGTVEGDVMSIVRAASAEDAVTNWERGDVWFSKVREDYMDRVL